MAYRALCLEDGQNLFRETPRVTAGSLSRRDRVGVLAGGASGGKSAGGLASQLRMKATSASISSVLNGPPFISPNGDMPKLGWRCEIIFRIVASSRVFKYFADAFSEDLQ